MEVQPFRRQEKMQDYLEMACSSRLQTILDFKAGEDYSREEIDRLMELVSWCRKLEEDLDKLEALQEKILAITRTDEQKTSLGCHEVMENLQKKIDQKKVEALLKKGPKDLDEILEFWFQELVCPQEHIDAFWEALASITKQWVPAGVKKENILQILEFSKKLEAILDKNLKNHFQIRQEVEQNAIHSNLWSWVADMREGSEPTTINTVASVNQRLFLSKLSRKVYKELFADIERGVASWGDFRRVFTTRLTVAELKQFHKGIEERVKKVDLTVDNLLSAMKLLSYSGSGGNMTRAIEEVWRRTKQYLNVLEVPEREILRHIEEVFPKNWRKLMVNWMLGEDVGIEFYML